MVVRVIEQGKEDTYEGFYPDRQYEFKLCGGSIEPKDRVGADAESGSAAAAKAKTEARAGMRADA